MRIFFVITGNEIISGFREETNFRFAAKRLSQLGWDLSLLVIGDSKEKIKEALSLAESKSDVIIVSGGLGSTSDDMTRYAASEYFSVELEENMEAKKHIEDFFERKGLTAPPLVGMQAMFPKGAKMLKNRFGTAFGFSFERRDKKFFFLPGVPLEFESIFSQEVMKQLSGSTSVYERVFKVFGLMETEIEERLKNNKQFSADGVNISFLPRFPEVTIRVYGEKERVDMLSDHIRNTIGYYVYSENDEDSLSSIVGKILSANGLTISVIESLTGGYLQDIITDVPGSSSYFKGGIVAYSDEMKMKLGVSKDIIQRFGAVSQECALSMAEAGEKFFDTDICISTTGVAGPSKICNKPVGNFFIGLSSRKTKFVKEFHFDIGRKRIKILCSYLAIDILRRYCLDNY